RSLNGGATWTPVSNPSTARLRDIEVVTGTILSAVGAGGQVVLSADGGITWPLAGAAGGNVLEQLWLDASNGYVVGPHLARRSSDRRATSSASPGGRAAAFAAVQ